MFARDFLLKVLLKSCDFEPFLSKPGQVPTSASERKKCIVLFGMGAKSPVLFGLGAESHVLFTPKPGSLA